MHACRSTLEDPTQAPTHPYTLGLLHANVKPGQRERPEAIPGSPPNLANLGPGCAFAPRCPAVAEACLEAVPEMRQVQGSHSARCILVPTRTAGANTSTPGIPVQ